MDEINYWLYDKLGSWTLEYFGLWLIIAAGLALILIITLITVAACHAKNKKKFKRLTKYINALEENAALSGQNVGDADAQKRLENAENAATLLSDRVDAQKRKIEELEDGNKEKQIRIDELSAALEQANSNAVGADKDLYRQINELSQTTREQENEINLLKAENAQIKAQALQQQLAATSSVKSAPRTTVVRRTADAETTATTEPTYDDEYDEYYDDYGDETSAVKVTLKFDHVKNNWIILRSDTNRTYRRLATKQEALVIAKDLSRRLHAQLVVHKKDGKFQKIQ